MPRRQSHRLRRAACSLRSAQGDRSADEIAGLRAERARLASERKEVQKDLKNAERKRQRLMSRARLLSNAELAAMSGARAAAEAKAYPQGQGESQVAWLKIDVSTS